LIAGDDEGTIWLYDLKEVISKCDSEESMEDLPLSIKTEVSFRYTLRIDDITCKYNPNVIFLLIKNLIFSVNLLLFFFQINIFF